MPKLVCVYVCAQKGSDFLSGKQRSCFLYFVNKQRRTIKNSNKFYEIKKKTKTDKQKRN